MRNSLLLLMGAGSTAALLFTCLYGQRQSATGTSTAASTPVAPRQSALAARHLWVAITPDSGARSPSDPLRSQTAPRPENLQPVDLQRLRTRIAAGIVTGREIVDGLAASGDLGEYSRLVGVLEAHASALTIQARFEVERALLHVMEHESDEDRRDAAIHYWLATGASRAVSDEARGHFKAWSTGHPSARVRAASLWLWTSGRRVMGRDAALAAALESDPDPLVRETAAEALGSDAEGGWTDSSLEPRLLTCLSREGQDQVARRLVESLVSRRRCDPQAAATVLGELVDRAANPGDRLGRLAALFALGAEHSRPWLVRWQDDPQLGEVARCYLALLDGAGWRAR